METLDVSVNIKLSEVLGKSGTWFPCLYIVNSELEADTYDEYKSLAQIADTENSKTTYGADTDVYKHATALFGQNNKPEKIAVLAQKDFSASTLETYLGKGWRQLVLVGTHEKKVDIAEYIETTDKMVFVGITDETELSTFYDSVKSFDRTFVVYHTDETAVSAVVGATAGLSAGSFTYKNMIIKGIDALDWSADDLDGEQGIHKKGAITIVEKSGDIVTSEGIVASGKYADIVDSIDYVIQNISYNTQKTFNNNNKIPYTNNGISLLEIATNEALKDAYNNGIIADKEDGTPDYTVTFAMRSQTTEADRASRVYPYGNFSFALAGAIHRTVVNGVVSY